MQRRFDVEPGRDAVGLPVRRHLAGESTISSAVDGKSETDSIRIKNRRQQLEMTSDENGSGQRHMKGARNEQPAQGIRRQAREF